MYLSVNVRTLEKEHWALDENQGTKSYLLELSAIPSQAYVNMRIWI